MTKKTKEKYESACNDYVQAFCEKQSMQFEWWVGDQIGGVAYCDDFCFNLLDIIWDMNSDQPKHLIVSWYYSCLDNPETAVNYYTFTKMSK